MFNYINSNSFAVEKINEMKFKSLNSQINNISGKVKECDNSI